MNDRDRLIEQILDEASSRRGDAAEPRAGLPHDELDALIDEILGESPRRAPESAQPKAEEPKVEPPIAEQPQVAQPPAEQPSIEEPQTEQPSIEEPQTEQPQAEQPTAEQPPQPPQKARRQKRGKSQEDDPLARITPWAERHGAGRAQLPVAEGERARTGKGPRSLFGVLKKDKPKEDRSEVIYINTGAVRPPVEPPPPPVQEAGPLREVSSDTLEQTVRIAVDQLSSGDTRVVPPSAGEKTALFTLRDGETRPTSTAPEITGQVRLDGFDAPQQSPEDREEELRSKLRDSRKGKVEEFTINNPEMADQVDPIGVADDGEYHSPADAPELKFDLLARIRGASIRFWCTLIIGAVMLLLTLTDGVDLSNGLLTDNPVVMRGLYGALLLILLAVNARTILRGMGSLFSGRDPDTAPAAAWLVSVIQLPVCFVLDPSGTVSGSFALVGLSAVICLLMNLRGKRMMLLRVYRNLQLIGNDREKFAVEPVLNKDDAFQLGHGLAVGTPNVALARSVNHVNGFMYHSYAPDRVELSARVPAALLPLFGVGGAVAAYFLVARDLPATEMIVSLVSAFCCAVCAALPITALLAGNAAMNRVQRQLFRHRIMFSGTDAIEQLRDTDVITVDASQLFPEGSLSLKSIKSASNQSLDRSLMDVAGVVYMADCPLKPLFAGIIQGKTALLPEVDTLVYEEELGISGWVTGYRVLVGTRKLMENHGVIIPDTDFEQEANVPGLKAVYLSTQGILSAIFLVQYSADREVAAMLRQAVAGGCMLHVYSCDPNVTREMVCRLFKLPAGSVRIMGAVPRRAFKKQLESDRPAEALLTYERHAGDLCRGISAAKKLQRVLRFSAVLQSLFALLGVVLLCALMRLAGTGGFNVLYLTLYHIVTALLIVGLPRLFVR